MFAIPCSAQETPPLQDSAIQPFFWPVFWDLWVLPQNKTMPSGIILHQGLLQALLGHRKPSIETSGSWEIMDIYSKNRSKLWYRRESQERTSERRKTGHPVFSDRSSFLKIPVKRVGGRQFYVRMPSKGQPGLGQSSLRQQVVMEGSLTVYLRKTLAPFILSRLWMK